MAEAQAVRAVLLDLDGTINDSKPGIATGIRQGLAAVGVTVGEDHDWERYIGPPLAMMLADWHGLGPEEVDTAVAAYLEYYDRVGKYEATPYAGMLELVRDLAGDGTPVGVATAKRQRLAADIIDHVGLGSSVTVVAGARPDGTGAEKATVIATALEAMGLEPDPSVVMVGDRHHDMVGARAVGLTAIGVTWGYGSAEELHDAGAHRVLDAVADLRRQLGLSAA